MLTWYIIIIVTIVLARFVPNKEFVNDNNILIADNSKKKNQGSLFAIAIGAILSVTAGLRYCVGTDYSNYVHLYDGFLKNLWESIKTLKEPGVPILAKLGTYIQPAFPSMFFLVSIVTVSLYVRTIYKYCDSFWFGIALYLLTGEWQHSFNGIKQYLAAAILFAGYYFLLNKKFWKYLIIVFLASCCHVSAIVMVLPYFFVNKKFGLRMTVFMALIVVAVRFSGDSIFQVIGNFEDSFWMSNYVTEGVNWLRILVSCAPLFFIPFMSDEFKNDKITNFLINMCLLNAVIMIACANSRYLTRLSYYTQVYVCMAIPRFIRIFDERRRRIWTLIILLFYAVFWLFETTTPFYWIMNSPDWIFN